MACRLQCGFFILVVLSYNCMNVAGSVVDLAHDYWHHGTTCWESNEQFSIYDKSSGMGPNGQFVAESFSTPEHCGTHIDSPFHFDPNGWKLGEIPLGRMIAEGVHVNVSDEVNGNGDFVFTTDHLKAWERDNGPLPNRSVILVNFGWSHKFGDRQAYFNGLTEPYRFPGLSKDAAQWIVDSGKVYGVGTDGPSVDPGSNMLFETHGVLSKAGLYNLENVALNGTTLPPKGFKLVVQPIKIAMGTGGPVRILAFTNNVFE